MINIPTDLLLPGDEVDIEYRIHPGSNQTVVGLAISDIKAAVAKDPRFDYQGSRIESRLDKETLNVTNFLIIRVTVRRTPRAERVEVQEAGMGVGILIGLGTVMALALGWAAVHIAHLRLERMNVISHNLQVVTEEMQRISNDPNLSDETKREMIKAYQAVLATSQPQSVGSGIKQGITAAGSAVAMAIIIIAVLWVITRNRGGQYVEA